MDLSRTPLLFERNMDAVRTARMIGDHGQKPQWWPGRRKWLDTEHEFAHSMSRAAEQARRVVRRHGLDAGKRLGAGVSGVVHRAQDGGVIKFDKGDNEARLAHALKQHKTLSTLQSLPKVHKVIDTGVNDQKTGERIHAIHREDIGNLQSKRPSAWANFGNDVHHLSMGVRDGTIHPKEVRGKLRELHQRHRENIHPDEHGHFDQVHKDLHTMTKHGVLPCDLHADNWGSRQDGSVVMRDGGCYTLTHGSKGTARGSSSWARRGS